jgi:enamine deaminase RidA (YjgF/YER057c/UK114 family)
VVALRLPNLGLCGGADLGSLGLLLARQRAKCVLAGVEENVGHVDDQAARRVASLEDGVELLQPPDKLPTSTWIGVLALASKDFLIEIEAVAVLD